MTRHLTCFLLLLACGLSLACRPSIAGDAPKDPDEANTLNEKADAPMPETTETATFGGGCFWCTEAVFQRIEGVVSVTSGYAGGHVKNPSYRDVCAGTTGHAEVIQIVFDPAKVSFSYLLDAHFASHDPTTLNRQGADVGTQYRSCVIAHSPAQARLAKDRIAELNAQNVFGKPVVTTVEPDATFYPAEDYHQNYFRRNPTQGYCAAVIDPKIAKFKKWLETHPPHADPAAAND